MINEIKETNEYVKYLKEHCTNVKLAYEWLCGHCPDISVDGIPITESEKLYKDIFMHDESKLSMEEFDAYNEYFYGDKKDQYVKEKFDYAWLHHIHNNPHHWQHWILFEDDPKNEKGYKCLEMPDADIVHMICDWFSFSFKKGDLKEIFSWYEKHEDNIKLHQKTRQKVEYILIRIKDELESEV